MMARSLAFIAAQLYGTNTAQFARKRRRKKPGIAGRIVGRTTKGRLIRGVGLLAALGAGGVGAMRLRGKAGSPPIGSLGDAYSTGRGGSRQQRYDRVSR